MSESKSAQQGGIGFLGLLTIVFVTLKLCHVIDWSWWWVLLPMWGPVAICLVVIAVGFSMIGLAAALTVLAEKRKANNKCG